MRLCRNKRKLKLVWIDFPTPFSEIVLTCCKPLGHLCDALCYDCDMTMPEDGQGQQCDLFLFFLNRKKLPFFSHTGRVFLCVWLCRLLFVNISHLFLWLSLLDFRPPWTLNFSFPAFPVRCSKSSDPLHSIINLSILWQLYKLFQKCIFLKTEQQTGDKTTLLNYFLFKIG